MKNKKILILVDSFKGSLRSCEASMIIKESLLEHNSNFVIDHIPMADGGEGTVYSLVKYFNGRFISMDAHDPLGRIIETKYGLIDRGFTAVIEVASISGITLLNKNEINPWKTNTYGFGEVINHAINNGCQKLIVGLGGSATNDCGIGMLDALGVKFFDKSNKIIKPFLGNLKTITSFDASVMIEQTKKIELEILVDVTNPLCGKFGATKVYGKQKGVSTNSIGEVDVLLDNFSNIVEEKLSIRRKNIEGAGAAGGLGFAMLSFLNGHLFNGVNYLIEKFDLEEKIKNYDIVITGEGKLDSQSLYNKLPIGISKLCKKFNKKVVGIAGIIDDPNNQLEEHFDSMYSIVNENVSITESIAEPKKYLSNTVNKLANDLS